MRLIAILVAATAACSPHREPEATQAETTEEAKIDAAFDAIGDRIASEARAAAAAPHRSRIAVVETFASATPVGFYRYADTFTAHGLTLAQVGKLAAANPKILEQASLHLMARAQPALDALTRAITALPRAEAADCAELAHRIVTLRHGSGGERDMANVLDRASGDCVGLPPAAPAQ